jgi:hypothetical protein
MSVDATIYNYLAISLGGELVEIGSRIAAQTVTVTGEKFEIVTQITNTDDDSGAGGTDFQRQVIWQDGDGGLDDFDVLVMTSDADVLLELTIDRAGTPVYAVLGILADVPFYLTTDDFISAITVDGTETTVDQIDQIAVQNNSATANTATVRVLLIT